MNTKTQRARNLRKNATPQEKTLWNILRCGRLQNLKFRRQYPIGNYIVDFICKEKNLIIELDGGQHNETANIIYDQERTKFLESQGYKVLRFWNNEVDNNIDGVFEEITKFLKS